MKTMRKTLSVLLVLIMLLGVFPLGLFPAVGAVGVYNDISGHWAAGSINRYNNLGFLDSSIFTGNRFLPNRFITRVEFFSLLTRSLAATTRADVSGFRDVANLSVHLRNVIAAANQMGIAFGYNDGTMRPQGNLLRQEAATLVARTMGMESVAEWHLSIFSDGSFVSPYAKTYMAAFVEKGLLRGYPDGSLRPRGFITRAEAVTILDRLFNNVYLPESGFRNVYLQGGMLIQSSGADIRDAVIDGDVIIGDGVGNGAVVITNCTINGRLVIRGGGPNTITLSGTTVTQGIYVASFSADTRVAIADNSTSPILEAVSGFSLSGSGISEITILENARENAVVNLDGVSLNELNISGPGAQVNLNSGHVINARFDAAGQGSNLHLAANTSVGHLIISAPNASVTGPGSIRNLLINNSGAFVEQNPEMLTLGANINALVAGRAVSSVESQWDNNKVNRLGVNNNMRVQLLTNTTAMAPFDQATLNLTMVAGGTATETHVSQSAANRVPLTLRNERWGYWVGFFVPAPQEAASMASVTYTFVDGAPIALPPRTLDTLSGRQGLVIYLPVFREPGREVGMIKELVHINWGGHLTENLQFMSSTMHLAALNTSQRNSLQRDFDNKIMHSIHPGAAPYTGAEATRRILASDNPLGLPSRNNRGLDAVNRAIASAEVRSILEDPDFANDLTVDTSGNSQYSALSDAGKIWVAEQVLNARRTTFATPSAVKAAFDRAVQTRLASETSLLGQVNSSGDYAALRRIIENAANAAILQFQTGAEPYRSYTNAMKDRMADFLWNLRPYRSIQEIIDAIRRYLGDPANAPGDGSDITDIRDMQIREITLTVSPTGTTFSFGQHRNVRLEVILTDGRLLTPAQINALSAAGLIKYRWTNGDSGPPLPIRGAVAEMSQLTGAQANDFRVECISRGLPGQTRTDTLTFSLGPDANNRTHTRTLTFNAQQEIRAQRIDRIEPNPVIMFIDGPPVQLDAVLFPTNATETPEWFSDPTPNLTVTPPTGVVHVERSTGIVRALNPGAATITAVLRNEESRSVQVRVYRNADDIVVTPDKVVLTPNGSVTVTAIPATPGRTLFWWSLDDRLATVTWTGNSATIRAPWNATPGTTTVYVRTAGSDLFTPVTVEVRADTGVSMQLSKGAVMEAGDTQNLELVVGDEAMLTQRYYIRAEQMTPGMDRAAWFVGGDTTAVTANDDEITIQASPTGTGVVRIRLFTMPTGGVPVAELFITVAPSSPENVTFHHTGTSGTWYPSQRQFGDGERVNAGQIPVGVYGRPTLTMQVGDRPNITARTPQGILSRPMTWFSYVSNEFREVLYSVDTEPDALGTLHDREGNRIRHPNQIAAAASSRRTELLFDGGVYYLTFAYMFDGSGGFLEERRDLSPGAGGSATVKLYEFHVPNDTPTARNRLGFFWNNPTGIFISEAERLAVQRGGGIRRIITPIMTSENGSIIPTNPRNNDLAPGVSTGLASVAISPTRSITTQDPNVHREWGDLYYQMTDLWIPNPAGVTLPRIFNQRIAEQSNFVLQRRDNGEWVDVVFPYDVDGDGVDDLFSIHSVTENLIYTGDFRITDQNKNMGRVVSEDETVPAIVVGDPYLAANAFYIWLLPDPTGRPAINPLLVNRNDWSPMIQNHVERITFTPGSNDRFDFFAEDVTSLIQPYLAAQIDEIGDASLLDVRSFDGTTYLVYVETDLTIKPDGSGGPGVYNHLYAITQMSRRGFTPGGITGGARVAGIPSTSYRYQPPQHRDPLTYILTVTAPETPVQLNRTLYIGERTNNDHWDKLFFQLLQATCEIVGIDMSQATVSESFPVIPAGRIEIRGSGINREIIGIQAGTVLLTIRAHNDASKSVAVQYTVVPMPEPPPIPIYPASGTLTVGFSMAADDLPGVRFAATNAGIAPTNAVFESSDDTILTIESNGVATPRRAGRVDVTIREQTSSRTARVTIDVPANGVALPPPTPSPTPTPMPTPPPTLTPSPTPAPNELTAIRLRTSANVATGKTMRLEPFVTPFNANRTSLVWTSSDTSIATVSGGIVTGVKAGTVKITVANASGSISAECNVTVRADARPVTSIALSSRTMKLDVGVARTLTVTYNPKNATMTGVTWTSNASAVARVEPNGRVVAVAPGTATITAVSDSGGRVATCVVTVVIPVTSVTLPERQIRLKVGQTYQLVPTVNPSDATDQKLTYSSSATAIATVSSSGLITARRAGTATITVTAGGRKVTATVTVVR